MTELILFTSTYILVFALGMQSLNVNNGHYWAAAVTSFAIGSMQMVLFKLAPNATWSEIAAFLMGGPFGIVSSMWAHPRLHQLLKRDKTPAALDKETLGRLYKIDVELKHTQTRGR
jgi:hypothetical protein